MFRLMSKPNRLALLKVSGEPRIQDYDTNFINYFMHLPGEDSEDHIHAFLLHGPRNDTAFYAFAEKWISVYPTLIQRIVNLYEAKFDMKPPLHSQSDGERMEVEGSYRFH